MKRLLATVAILGVSGYGAIACSSAPSKPAVSHADQLACRTVYRLQELYNVSPAAISGVQATDALAEAAQGTAPKSFYESLAITADEMQAVQTAGGNTTTLLKPLLNECVAMGITSKNFEDVS
jgi:hypothetical protein